MNYIFKQLKEILPEHLRSYQLVYLANLDGMTDCVTKEFRTFEQFSNAADGITSKII